MSRSLPLCALCGETLRHKGRCLIKWTAKRGRPMIGWCESCDWGAKDPEFLRLRPQGNAGPADLAQVEPVLAAIEARGAGRVSWTKGKPS